MSNPVESTTSQPAPVAVLSASPKPAPSALMELLSNVAVTSVIAFLIALAVMYFAPQFMTQNDTAPQQKFVLINVDGLAREQILALGDKVQSGEIDVQDMPKKSKQFSLALMDLLKGYAQQNVIVLRADTVVMAPATIEDVTENLRSELVKSGAMQVGNASSGGKK